MSDIFFLPLDRVIRLMKIIFNIKWHKMMEDTSTKMSCAWDHQDKMIKFPEIKENLWGRFLQKLVPYSERGPRHFLSAGEQRVNDLLLISAPGWGSLKRKESLLWLPCRKGTFWARVCLMTHKTKPWKKWWLQWSVTCGSGELLKGLTVSEM